MLIATDQVLSTGRRVEVEGPFKFMTESLGNWSSPVGSFDQKPARLL
jgi:hypothetical protein